MNTLDANSSVPLHAQLEEIIRAKISDGTWSEESRIPSENELSREYGLSRMTVRSVILRLTQEGLLYRVAGKGTFVKVRKIMSKPPSHMGIRDQLIRKGIGSVTEVLKAEVVVSAGSDAMKLDLDEGVEIFDILRLRSVEGRPFSLNKSLIPCSVCPDLLKAGHSFETEQMGDILRDSYGIIQDRMVETLEVVAADAETAAYLGVKKGYPLMHLENTVYDKNGKPVEYSSVYFRGDRIKLEIVNTYTKE